ncbi:Basic-leucine zipper transcription factor [Parasponia andersonii]|uniref:Basic-leucine zipper transcription factor n=1 Tax=Parasponia andersonii TaxID=3476 RepID=A0A2P5CAD6_PARAD|nr:Basic-leucine zipper transcription factor [Parasponia andersonii]
MQQPGGEISGLHFLVPSNPSPYPDTFTMNQNNSPNFQLNRFSIPLFNNFQFPSHHHHHNHQVQEITIQQSSCFSNNSTSDEADEHQLSLINERKQRRMISNRESARRSRMRKQKHLDELWSQVVWLRNENHQLMDKLNHVSESHDRVVQENVQLKEEASELRQMLSDIQLHSPFPSLRDLEDVPCNTAYLRAESSNQSITTSMDLLG